MAYDWIPEISQRDEQTPQIAVYSRDEQGRMTRQMAAVVGGLLMIVSKRAEPVEQASAGPAQVAGWCDKPVSSEAGWGSAETARPYIRSVVSGQPSRLAGQERDVCLPAWAPRRTAVRRGRIRI